MDDEQEEDLDKYIHEEEEEATENSMAVTIESVIPSKTISSLFCNVVFMIFRKTRSSGLGTRSWRRRWSPRGRQ